jgi:hypothetical protein
MRFSGRKWTSDGPRWGRCHPAPDLHHPAGRDEHQSSDEHALPGLGPSGRLQRRGPGAIPARTGEPAGRTSLVTPAPGHGKRGGCRGHAGGCDRDTRNSVGASRCLEAMTTQASLQWPLAQLRESNDAAALFSRGLDALRTIRHDYTDAVAVVSSPSTARRVTESDSGAGSASGSPSARCNAAAAVLEVLGAAGQIAWSRAGST